MRVKATKNITTLTYSPILEITKGKSYRVKGNLGCHKKDEYLIINNFCERRWYPADYFEIYETWRDKIVMKFLDKLIWI